MQVNVAPLVASEVEQLRKQMSQTDNNIKYTFNTSNLNHESDVWDEGQAGRGRAADDAKSVRSTKTGKTMFTTKTRYAANGVKVVSTSHLAPVGMNRLHVPTPVGPPSK